MYALIGRIHIVYIYIHELVWFDKYIMNYCMNERNGILLSKIGNMSMMCRMSDRLNRFEWKRIVSKLENMKNKYIEILTCKHNNCFTLRIINLKR